MKNMKAFASWSGGKDCMLALNRFVNEKGNNVECLVNMCNSEGTHSRSHGITKELIQQQAECLEIPIIQQAAGMNNYAECFKEVICELKTQGINTGVFGDIYLEAHRTWINNLCDELDITPVFPLWGESTDDLLEEFINTGFKTIVVAVDNTKLNSEWLGKTIDTNFLKEIKLLENIDACAENGEYHSFVYDGPVFKKAVVFSKGKIHTEAKNSFLELISI